MRPSFLRGLFYIMKNWEDIFKIGFLIIISTICAFILIEAIIMFKTPTSPDNEKIRMEIIGIISVMSLGILNMMTNRKKE